MANMGGVWAWDGAYGMAHGSSPGVGGLHRPRLLLEEKAFAPLRRALHATSPGGRGNDLSVTAHSGEGRGNLRAGEGKHQGEKQMFENVLTSGLQCDIMYLR